MCTLAGTRQTNGILSYRTPATEINFNLVIDFVADRIRNLMDDYFRRNVKA